MAKDEKNIHSGHRERLLETVCNVGLQGLSKIQIMEFILFYIFPRGDVNPLAHRLLDKFKNISFVLDASVEDLMAVRGMGRTSARKLRSLVEIFNVYTSSKASRKGGLNTFGDIHTRKTYFYFGATGQIFVAHQLPPILFQGGRSSASRAACSTSGSCSSIPAGKIYISRYC